MAPADDIAHPSPDEDSGLPLVFTSPQQEAAFRAAVREGIASADAGRLIPWEDVRRWMLSWGTPNELPPPECK